MSDESKMSKKKKRVTTKLILEGLSHREEVEVEEYPDMVFVLAPITAVEHSQVRAAALSGVDFSSMKSMEDEDIVKAVDVPSLVKQSDEAKFLALSFSLTRGMDEKWTAENVGSMNPGVPEKLYDVLDGMCGLSEEMRRRAKGFRGRRRARR